MAVFRALSFSKFHFSTVQVVTFRRFESGAPLLVELEPRLLDLDDIAIHTKKLDSTVL